MRLVISLVIAIASIVGLWKIFEKAGLEGWKSIIPLYNSYCLFKITWGNGWFFLLCFIPIVNIVIYIMTMNKLAKSFDKGVGYTIGLVLLAPIFIILLGLGDDEFHSIVEA
jgi:hypothetical protein